MAEDTVNLIAQLGGELVTYTPSGDVAREFLALVDRGRSSPQIQQTNGHGYSVNTREVLIAKHATFGMTNIQEHKDKVRFKKNLSDAAPTDFTVQQILREDDGVAGSGGAFVVLVQA
jgi:hypothetical protein